MKALFLLSVLFLTACGQIGLYQSDSDVNVVSCVAAGSGYELTYDLTTTRDELSHVKATIKVNDKTYTQDAMMTPYSATWSEKAVYLYMNDGTQLKVYYVKKFNQIELALNGGYIYLSSNVCR